MPSQRMVSLIPFISLCCVVQEVEMTCLMNFREDEAVELQDAELQALAASERQQLRGLHDRCAPGETMVACDWKGRGSSTGLPGN